MRLGPALYLRRTMALAFFAWVLLRLIAMALALRAQEPEPWRLAPSAAATLALVVAGVVWLDLRRRHLVILLPNLGIPVSTVLGAAAGLALGAELVVGLLQ
ncbi:MAG: hypothetical protein R2909_12265 [Gemmatimonadales bacterium]